MLEVLQQDAAMLVWWETPSNAHRRSPAGNARRTYPWLRLQKRSLGGTEHVNRLGGCLTGRGRENRAELR